MDSISTLLVAIPALPLLSAVLTAILGPRVLRHRSHWLTIGALVGAFACSALLVRQVNTQQSALQVTTNSRNPNVAPPTVSFERVITLWTWANVADAYQQP